jgi:hypothetical protein
MAADDRVESRVEVHVFGTGEPPHGFGRFFQPATCAELWAGLSLVGLSLLGAAWVIHGRSAVLALERDPVRVDGRVVRLWVTKENNGHHYRVEYEYAAEAGGRVFRGETQLLPAHYDMLREGGPIAMNVSRSDPANHQVIGGRPPMFASAESMRVPLGFVGLFAAAGAVNLWWWWVSRGTAGLAGVLVVGTVAGRRTGAG